MLELADGTEMERNQRLAGHPSLERDYWGCQGILNDVSARCARHGEEIWIAKSVETEPGVWFAILTRNDEEVYRVQVGGPSVWPVIQALWVWDTHWALETLRHDFNPENGSWSILRGQVSLDGELMNEKHGYEEAFNFSLIGGKPFFFFYKNGQAGLWYDGQEVLLGYEEVPHYLCCSTSTKNPATTLDLATFFGRRGQQWYYVEARLAMP